MKLNFTTVLVLYLQDRLSYKAETLTVHSLVTVEKRSNKMEFNECVKMACFHLAGHIWQRSLGLPEQCTTIQANVIVSFTYRYHLVFIILTANMHVVLWSYQILCDDKYTDYLFCCMWYQISKIGIGFLFRYFDSLERYLPIYLYTL